MRKINKLLAMLLALTMVIGLAAPMSGLALALFDDGDDEPPVVEMVRYELGMPTIEGQYSIWRTNGEEGFATNLEMTYVKLATQLIVQYTSRPASNVEIVFQSSTMGWGQSTLGRPAAAGEYTYNLLGLVQNWDANEYGFLEFIKADSGKFFLTQWGNALAISNAWLLIPKLVVPISGPDETVYDFGSGFDAAGMEIWAYNPETTSYDKVALSNDNTTVTGYNPMKFGDQTVTITYSAFGLVYNSTVTVTVEPPVGGLTISDQVIYGIVPPRTGQPPVTAITPATEFTGTVSWSPALADGLFAANTVYTATINLAAEPFYKFEGVAADYFMVANNLAMPGSAVASNDADSGVVTAVYPATVAVDKLTMGNTPATEFVAGMKIGWNLGNTFDASPTETSWVSTPTSKAIIDKVADAGFDVFRMPITWTAGSGSDWRVRAVGDTWEINPVFLARVEQIVNWALDNGMYVIINAHHDTWMNQMTNTGFANNSNRVATTWRLVAEHFADYGEKLIFETMNEPRISGENEWTGSAEAYDVVNRYNQLLVDTIRATGGKNEMRYILAPGFAASSGVTQMNAYVLATDMHPNRLIASVHAYSPYDFCLNNPNPDTTSKVWGTATDKQDLRKLFTDIDRTFTSKGIAVILGEMGAMSRNNDAYRADWAKYFISGAKSYDIPCIWWDNNVFTGTGERFGLLNRATLTYPSPQVVQGLMAGLSFIVPLDLTINPDYNTATKEWRIAATIKNIDRTPGAVYSGEVELISPAGYTLASSLAFDSLLYGDESVLYFELDPDFVSPTPQVTSVFAYRATDGVAMFTGDMVSIRFGLVSNATYTILEPFDAGGNIMDHLWDDSDLIDLNSLAVTDGRGNPAGTPATVLDPADLSATMKLAWDSDYLFVNIDVTDDIHTQTNSGGNIWQGDSIQISVGDGEGFNEMGFARHNNGNIAQYSWLDTWRGANTGNINTNDIKTEISRDEGAKLTSYKIAIKWDYLYMDGNDLNVGDMLKLSVCINDWENDQRQVIEYGEGISIGAKGSNMGNLYLLGPVGPDYADVSISGPAVVASGANTTATYTISVTNMPTVSGIELEFEVDGNFLSSNSFVAPDFSFLGEWTFGTPIYWRQVGDKWVGKVTLYNLDGVAGDLDIIDLIFNVPEGVVGVADVKLNYIRMSFFGDEVFPVVSNDVVTTEFVKWYSPYDLNKDGTVDLNDLTWALQYLMVTKDDPEWAIAYVADFDESGMIDISDLLLIMANYSTPYYG